MSEMQMVPWKNVPRPVPGRQAGPTEQGMSARFVLGAVRRWWKWAVPAGLLLAAAGGLTVCLLFEPVYEAAAWFKIEERTPFLAFETKDEGRSKLFFQTQIETIRSPLVLGPVIKRQEIARQPEIARQTDKVAWLGRQIKVTSVGESELFRILYSAPDPKDAAAVVNAVTESYFKLRDQSDTERNQRIIDLLSQEQEKRSNEVLRLRNNLRSLAKDVVETSPFGGPARAEAPQKHPLAELENRLVMAQVEIAMLDARIKATEEEVVARNTGGDNDPGVNKNLAGNEPDTKGQITADGSEAKQREGALAAKRAEQEVALCDAMAERMIEQSPEIQDQKKLVAEKRAKLTQVLAVSAKGKQSSAYTRLADELQRDEQALDQLRKEMKPRAVHDAESILVAKRIEAGSAQIEALAKMRSDREAARVMVQVLKERYDAERKQLQADSGGTMDLEFKRDELTRAEKVFELIAQRALQLQTERGAPARVTLMQSAELPGIPVEVFPYRNVILASLVGLCLPLGLAVGWERLVGRVSDSLSLERQSNVSVVGGIAHLPARTPANHCSQVSRTSHDLRFFEESIDSLRTSLTLSQQFGDLRVLAVTSPANREGKTSVVSQLAVSFTRATGKPLLLIDGDMRCPDIHNVFDVPLEPGLAGVLSGQCRLEEAIVTGWSDLVHLLPAGRLMSSPHSLLGNGAWTSLLAQIPPLYRYVLIDTPPLLAASEALVLTKYADAALVCVMRDVSRMDQIRRILDRLAAAGSRPVGLVLNGVPVKNYSYRYGAYSYSR